MPVRVELRPVTLEGRHARLVPLEPSHAPALYAATAETEIWTWMPISISSEDDMRRFVGHAASVAERGEGLGFAIFAAGEPTPIGSTGFWNVDHQHRRAEIGATWLNRSWQRTGINTECKLLLLRHAFTQLGCIRVEFKTDATNARSRAALQRIGAVEEGTLRQHMVLTDGRLRDSVYFSVLDHEWSAVEARLEQRLTNSPSTEPPRQQD